MLSNHLILCLSLLLLPSIFASIRVFSSQLPLCIRWSSALCSSASASVLQMGIQDWFPLGLTRLVSLLSKGLSRVFYSTTVPKPQFFGTQPSLLLNSHTLMCLLEKQKQQQQQQQHSFDHMDLCWQSDGSALNTLSKFVIAFLPRRKGLLISWLLSLYTVILEHKKIKSVTVFIWTHSIC